MNVMSDYVLNEKDIETVLRYLRIHNPENADRDYAIQKLELMQSAAGVIANSGILTDEQVKEALEKQDKAN